MNILNFLFSSSLRAKRGNPVYPSFLDCFVVLLLAMTVSAILSTSTYAAEKESAYERVIKTGVLKCGYGLSPPILEKDPNTGKMSGFDVDVWEEIGKNLDLKIEWVESSGWGTYIEDLKSGRYDAFCSEIWLTPSRTKFASLSIPIIYSFLNTYVRADDKRFGKNLDSFNSESIKIPVIDGDITEYMTKTRFPKAQRLSLPNSGSWADLYLAVTTKKADVLFIDPPSYKAVAENSPVKLKKIDIPPAFTFASYYSFNQSDSDLRDMVNVILQTMVDSGQLEKMAQAASPDYTTPRRNYGAK